MRLFSREEKPLEAGELIIRVGFIGGDVGGVGGGSVRAPSDHSGPSSVTGSRTSRPSSRRDLHSRSPTGLISAITDTDDDTAAGGTAAIDDLRDLPDTLVFTAPRGLTAAELRLRVKGLFFIPFGSTFLYCGAVLADADPIPDECFEANSIEDENDVIFRPRLVMVIELDKREIDPEIDGKSDDQGEENTEIGNNQDAFTVDAAESRRQDEIEKQQEIAEIQALTTQILEIQPNKFDFLDELRKINCSVFYETLCRAGFDQEVHCPGHPTRLNPLWC